MNESNSGHLKESIIGNLRELEAVGLVTRTDLGGSVRRVEYSLADHISAETSQLLDELAQWREHQAISKAEEKPSGPRAS